MPTNLGEVQLDQPRLISDDPAPMPLIGKLWRARRAMTRGAACHARSAPPWHVADEWDAPKLADAPPGESTDDSKIGLVAADSAPIVGIPDQVRDYMGPRAELLEVAETATSVRDVQFFADWGAKLNILRNADLSSHLVPSGIRLWRLFRGAAQRSQFPPTGGGVRAGAS